MPETCKVAFAFCAEYDATLGPALDRAVGLLGGWGAFVRPGMHVLVKPNLVLDRSPENAVTTHPEFLREVIRALKRCGADVSVADSPGFAVDLHVVWKTTGVEAVCAAEGVPLLNLEAAGWRKVERDGHTFGISKPVAESDLVVNLPKVKSHAFTRLTAAVKNFYGTVPGFMKTELHKTYTRRPQFGRLVQAIARSMPPTLNLADAVVGMDGEGPSAGQPIRLGFVAAAADAFAMDVALCRVLHISPADVPYLADCWNRPPYTAIDCLGDAPDAPNFRQNAHSRAFLRHIPDWVAHAIARRIWFRPVFGEACVSCGRCVKSCPMTAITMEPGRRPLLNGPLCVGCCCCHELCPTNAIRIQPSPLLMFLIRFRSARDKRKQTLDGAHVAGSQ
jgi:uncharacterized protein (DUF362 family)/Pyruvate/2-oxoacid:ferredoxin oxidoreductase delta subunit